MSSSAVLFDSTIQLGHAIQRDRNFIPNLSSMSEEEPILVPNEQRFVLFPIQHSDIWEMYKSQIAGSWFAEDLYLKPETEPKCEPEEHKFVKSALLYLRASDKLVDEKTMCRMCNEVQVPEARSFYAFQIARANIHMEAYSLLLFGYIPDPEERMRITDSATTKVNWTSKYMKGDDVSFAERLVAFVSIEAIFFSSISCIMYRFQKRRCKMPALLLCNELVTRDKGLQCVFACLLYSKLEHRLTQQRVCEIVSEAVEVEKHFISAALDVESIEMEVETIWRYIEYVADRWLVIFGYEKKYKTLNPFDWMDKIALQSQNHLFEKQVTESNKTKTHRTTATAATTTTSLFTLDAAF